MKILIYTYANHKIGTGNIYTMLNLCEELEKRGDKVVFFIPGWKEGIEKIRQARKKSIEIPIPSFEKGKDYEDLLRGYYFDCIIADALNVPQKITQFFRTKTRLLVSLNNAGSGRKESDILFNIVYRNKEKLKGSTMEINDFKYLILNKHFANVHLKKKNIQSQVKKILIIQGGTDAYVIIPKLINLLPELKNDIEYYVMIGCAFKHDKELDLAVKNKSLKIKVLRDIKNTWDIFSKMDMAISAGGMTLFELMCCGVPCLTVTGEARELETINYIEQSGAVENMGFYKKNKDKYIAAKILEMALNTKRRMEMSGLGKKIIDGKGCQRSADLICQLAEKTIKINK